MKRNTKWIGSFILLTGFTLTVLSCQNEIANKATNTEESKTELQDSSALKRNAVAVHATDKVALHDTIVLSEKHNPNVVFCDMDGDNRMDTVHIVQNTKNNKYGLKVTFGNEEIAYLGMGQDILGQGFDDIDWVGIFEKAPKGEVYYNNVNDEGEIISEEEVNESDKIKLPNDGVFIHQTEACGGGVIYLNKGEFEWIQQE